MGIEPWDLVGGSGLLGICPDSRLRFPPLTASLMPVMRRAPVLYDCMLPAVVFHLTTTEPWSSGDNDHGLQPGNCEPRQTFLPRSSLSDTLFQQRKVTNALDHYKGPQSSPLNTRPKALKLCSKIPISRV